ncbi:DUF664 domain-containing protein [Actinoplanes sp. NPDC049265]|uniref:mycothiol transferase n=1 Tax=Actinoplanes sp. NPDC049265 TaxID=3363902 RepID=UPI00371D6CF0
MTWSTTEERRVNPEVEALQATLESLRAGVLKKLAGLSEDDARRSTVGSGTSVAGLVQHLTFVESAWFGVEPPRGLRSMTVDPSIPLRTLRADYKAACQAGNAVIAAAPDADAPVTSKGRLGTLRTALLAVIAETARHAGHADIIREQIDGVTGR